MGDKVDIGPRPVAREIELDEVFRRGRLIVGSARLLSPGVIPESRVLPCYITGTNSPPKVGCAMNGYAYGDSASTALTPGSCHDGHAPLKPRTV
jgi:hypothetical protein